MIGELIWGISLFVSSGGAYVIQNKLGNKPAKAPKAIEPVKIDGRTQKEWYELLDSLTREEFEELSLGPLNGLERDSGYSWNAKKLVTDKQYDSLMRKWYPERYCKSCGKKGCKEYCLPIERSYYPSKIKLCGYCNKEGHTAKTCPKLKPTTVCLSCGSDGHVSGSCNTRWCSKCGSTKHNTRDHVRPPVHKCAYCADPGHTTTQCPLFTERKTCKHCDSTVHRSDNCPNLCYCGICRGNYSKKHQHSFADFDDSFMTEVTRQSKELNRLRDQLKKYESYK